MRKWLAFGVGALLGAALMVVGQAVARPALSDADRAYCAAHADVVADVWRLQRSELSFDPRMETDNIRGYFRSDVGATVLLAARTYPDGNWGEQAPRNRVNEQLGAACRALTHP